MRSVIRVDPSSPPKAVVSTSMSVNCSAIILRRRTWRSAPPPKSRPKSSLTPTSGAAVSPRSARAMLSFMSFVNMLHQDSPRFFIAC